MPRNPRQAAKRSDERSRSRSRNKLEERRAIRYGINGYKNVLSFPDKDGYHRRLVVDKGNQLSLAQKIGYKFVEEEIWLGDDGVTDQNLSPNGGARVYVGDDHRTGKPQYGYLMEIPLEDYLADQELKAAEIDATEADIRETIKADGYYGQFEQEDKLV